MKTRLAEMWDKCSDTADRVLELHYEASNARAIGDYMGALRTLARMESLIRARLTACRMLRVEEEIAEEEAEEALSLEDGDD